MEETSLTKEQLLMKSNGVKDCVKWIEKKLKDEKEQLKYDEDMWNSYGMFEDCGESYKVAVYERKARMEALVETKISLQKYMKKLKHMAEEV